MPLSALWGLALAISDVMGLPAALQCAAYYGIPMELGPPPAETREKVRGVITQGSCLMRFAPPPPAWPVATRAHLAVAFL